MQITFKLFATLTDYLPPASRNTNIVALEVAPEATILQIIEPFGLPPNLVHLVWSTANTSTPQTAAPRRLNLAMCWPSGRRSRVVSGWLKRAAVLRRAL